MFALIFVVAIHLYKEKAREINRAREKDIYIDIEQRRGRRRERGRQREGQRENEIKGFRKMEIQRERENGQRKMEIQREKDRNIHMKSSKVTVLSYYPIN